jgi:hypothetical protein
VPALASARNPIDAFIRARLAKEGLQPSPAADRRTLLRRVTLDLTGLAPEPAQIEAFVKDKSADASEKVVDPLRYHGNLGIIQRNVVLKFLDANRRVHVPGEASAAGRHVA